MPVSAATFTGPFLLISVLLVITVFAVLLACYFSL